MRGPINKEPVIQPTTVIVTGTLTEVWSGRVPTHGLLTLGIYNQMGGAQTLNAVIYRKQTDGSQWKESYLADFTNIADGQGRMADIDIRGTIWLRVDAIASGAGGNVEIEATQVLDAW